MNRTGFPTQNSRIAQPQPSAIANRPTGPSSRLQNGKGVLNSPGPGPGWGFGVSSAAPGLTNRAPGATSFAQTIGGGPQTPLDPSEFPTLGRVAGNQFQNPGQAVWAQQRTTQQQVMSPQRQPASVIGAPAAADTASRSLGQMPADVSNSRDNEPQRQRQDSGHAETEDDFPPLNRDDQADIGHQPNMLPPQSQASVPFDGIDGARDSLADTSRSVEMPIRSLPPGTRPAQRPGFVQSPQQPEINRATIDSIENMKQEASERWKLRNLIAKFKSAPTEQADATLGHDLMGFRLDLNAPKLLPSWGTPFNERSVRPRTPEFTLPQCYSVRNTRPLASKIKGFNDDTLLVLFVLMPGDMHQELAAVELTTRNWRYYKPMQTWITRSKEHPEPQPITVDAERGTYQVFNTKTFHRETKDLVIRWADLDGHILNSGSMMELAGGIMAGH